MSFSCTIKTGERDFTDFDEGPIHSQLLGLGAHCVGDDESPYSVSDFRSAVADCVYGDRLKDAAQDCFRQLQRMAKENLESIVERPHCDTCACETKERDPKGWSAEALRALLAIDPNTVTYLSGGY